MMVIKSIDDMLKETQIQRPFETSCNLPLIILQFVGIIR